MIKLLIEPDAKCPNEEEPNGALMNLYLESNVEKIERSDEFLDMFEKINPDADISKMNGTLRWAKNAKINLTDNLHITAIAESLNTDDGQTIVAFIRHYFTNYEKLMDACDGRYGSKEGKKVIRIRVLRRIAKCYPGLRPGCRRQWMKWYQEDLAF
jgi:hypothetical protein